MHPSATSLFSAPYGLSFSIEELVMVRSWAKERGLRMIVALDQTAEQAEFEEMLVLAPPDRNKRIFIVWRTLGSVFVQVPHGRPCPFPTLEEALGTLRLPTVKRSSLLRFFGFPE